MKYIILIGDGMAGYPLKELRNKTTLATARTPMIDTLAGQGILGLVQNVPQGMQPGSDIASMSIFGYNPKKVYSGRAPLEAAAQNIKLGPNDVAFRCNLVTIKNNIMKDFTAHHIKTLEAKKIITALQKKLGNKTVQFYPGVSYRHLVVIKNGPLEAKCTPPHDITDKNIDSFMPAGKDSDVLRKLMEASKEIIAGTGSTATQIWLWGQGKAPKLETITNKYSVSGAVITAVDLLKGIGKYAGLEVINVKGATGFIDTNYAGKVAAGIKALQKHDLLVLHIEAPDECGHMGDYILKIKAIEDFDQKVVQPIVETLYEQKEDFRMIILPDHPTPVSKKTHTGEPVPFVFYDSTKKHPSVKIKYCEKNAAASNIIIKQGSHLLERLLHAVF